MSNNIDDGSESLRLKQDESLLKDFALIALEKGLAVQHQPLDTLSVHDLAALRRIIAAVIDDGDDGGYWKFHLGQHDIHIKAVTKADLDAVRSRFIEAIITRIVATAAPRSQHESRPEEVSNANVD